VKGSDIKEILQVPLKLAHRLQKNEKKRWRKGMVVYRHNEKLGLSPDFEDFDWCEWATKNSINQV